MIVFSAAWNKADIDSSLWSMQSYVRGPDGNALSKEECYFLCFKIGSHQASVLASASALTFRKNIIDSQSYYPDQKMTL